MDIVFCDVRWTFSYAFTPRPTDALITSSGKVRCTFGYLDDGPTLDWQLSTSCLAELNALLICAKMFDCAKEMGIMCDGPVGHVTISYRDGAERHYDATQPMYDLIAAAAEIVQHDPRQDT